MALTPQEQNEMRALECIYDHDNAGTHGSISDFRRMFGDHEAASIATSLKQVGLLGDTARGNGDYRVTAEGRAAVERMVQQRTDGSHRRRVCREVLLAWVDSNTTADEPGSRVPREQFDGSEDLLPFTDAETVAAAGYLHECGLIGTISAAQAKHILLWIVGAGQDALDAGGVEAYLARTTQSSPTTNYTFTGTGNTFATATAAGAVASATVTNFNLDHARLFAAAIRLAAADIDLSQEAAAALAEIDSGDAEGASKAAKFL